MRGLRATCPPQRRPHRRTVRCAGTAAIIALLGLLGEAAAAHAQVDAEARFRPGTWMIGASLGGAAFTDFQRGVARAQDSELGDFRRRISAATTASASGSVTYWIGAGFGVRGAVGFAPSTFRVWNDERAQRVLDERNGGERERYARLSVWFVDATAIYRLPVRLGRIVPYGLAGVGLVEHRSGGAEPAPPEAEQPFAGGRWRAPAAVFGLGAAVPLQRLDLLLTFELTDHLTRTPLNEEARGEWVELGGVPVQLDREAERGNDGIAVTNHLRLNIGLTLPVR